VIKIKFYDIFAVFEPTDARPSPPWPSPALVRWKSRSESKRPGKSVPSRTSSNRIRPIVHVHSRAKRDTWYWPLHEESFRGLPGHAQCEGVLVNVYVNDGEGNPDPPISRVNVLNHIDTTHLYRKMRARCPRSQGSGLCASAGGLPPPSAGQTSASPSPTSDLWPRPGPQLLI